MRTTIAAAFVCSPLLPVTAVSANAALQERGERASARQSGESHSERASETYRIGDGGALDLSHLSGDVRVTVTRGRDIRIDTIKRVRHESADEAKRLLQALGPRVLHTGNRVQVRTQYPTSSGRNLNFELDYEIAVPQDTTVFVKAISGDLSVHDVRGEVRVETISGDIEVVSTPNLALAKTASGDVRARNITAAALTLGTLSGDLIADGLKVRTLDASSVSGDVQLVSVQADRIVAKSTSGNIVFAGSLAPGGRYELNAHSGNVRVILGDRANGFTLDAATFNGSIHSDFPLRGGTARASAGDSSSDRRRRARGDAVQGTFGDGSAVISARSFSGNVAIVRQ